MARMFWTQKQDIGPSGREVHRMTYDSNRQRVVLFGGRAGTTVVFKDTWEWDGEYWTQMNDLGPPSRSAHTLVFDSIRQRTVCFGGLSNISDPSSAFGDTWEWDGQDWTQMADTGPAARAFHAMAFDSDRGRTVLFGGQITDGFLNDTWEWDGTEWTQVTDTGPSPRDACGATYDASRQRMILFGGEIVNAGMVAQVGETWEFGGGAWTQVATTGPGPIVGAEVVFNGTFALLFNPVDGSTWTWDGRHWTARQDIGPGSRVGVAMTFDSQRKRAVMAAGKVGYCVRIHGNCSRWRELSRASYGRSANSAIPRPNLAYRVRDARQMGRRGEVKSDAMPRATRAEQLAELSGFSRQYISGLEQGRRNRTVASLYELATALGVNHMELAA